MIVEGIVHGYAARGKRRTPEYRAWAAMNSRCHNENDAGYKYYGGRGIVVCKEWRSPHGFLAFLAHVGKRPSAKYSIDRERNNEGYKPGNVRWATKVEQMMNRRNNRYVVVNGERKPLKAWCKEFGVDYRLAWNRIMVRGYSPEEALIHQKRVA